MRQRPSDAVNRNRSSGQIPFIGYGSFIVHDMEYQWPCGSTDLYGFPWICLVNKSIDSSNSLLPSIQSKRLEYIGKYEKSSKHVKKYREKTHGKKFGKCGWNIGKVWESITKYWENVTAQGWVKLPCTPSVQIGHKYGCSSPKKLYSYWSIAILAFLKDWFIGKWTIHLTISHFLGDWLQDD